MDEQTARELAGLLEGKSRIQQGRRVEIQADDGRWIPIDNSPIPGSEQVARYRRTRPKPPTGSPFCYLYVPFTENFVVTQLNVKGAHNRILPLSQSQAFGIGDFYIQHNPLLVTFSQNIAEPDIFAWDGKTLQRFEVPQTIGGYTPFGGGYYRGFGGTLALTYVYLFFNGNLDTSEIRTVISGSGSNTSTEASGSTMILPGVELPVSRRTATANGILVENSEDSYDLLRINNEGTLALAQRTITDILAGTEQYYYLVNRDGNVRETNRLPAFYVRKLGEPLTALTLGEIEMQVEYTTNVRVSVADAELMLDSLVFISLPVGKRVQKGVGTITGFSSDNNQLLLSLNITQIQTVAGDIYVRYFNFNQTVPQAVVYTNNGSFRGLLPFINTFASWYGKSIYLVDASVTFSINHPSLKDPIGIAEEWEIGYEAEPITFTRKFEPIAAPKPPIPRYQVGITASYFK